MSSDTTINNLVRDVAVQDHERSCVIKVSGDLDLVGGYDLRQAFAGALHRGTGAVLLDLSSVTAVDDQGLASLEWCSTRARQAQRPFTWTACSQPLAHHLEQLAPAEEQRTSSRPPGMTHSGITG